MTVTIRAAQAEDKTAWEGLWDQYLAFYGTERGQVVKDAAWARIMDPAEGMYCLLAMTEDGTPVGLANFLLHASFWEVAPVCYLNDLFVDPQARGQGAARRLLEASHAAAVEAGAVKYYWLTAGDNAAARGLYDQLAQKTPFVHYVMPVPAG